MEIRETDLMLVCMEAAKSLVSKFDLELNDALGRISVAMYRSGDDGARVVRAVNNPVERDIVERCNATAIGLVLGLEDI